MLTDCQVFHCQLSSKFATWSFIAVRHHLSLHCPVKYNVFKNRIARGELVSEANREFRKSVNMLPPGGVIGKRIASASSQYCWAYIHRPTAIGSVHRFRGLDTVLASVLISSVDHVGLHYACAVGARVQWRHHSVTSCVSPARPVMFAAKRKKNKSSFKRFQENSMETSSKFKETKGKIMASGAFSGIADMGDPECYVTFAHEKIW